MFINDIISAHCTHDIDTSFSTTEVCQSVLILSSTVTVAEPLQYSDYAKL